jgi:hypothetical protein
VVDQAPVLRYQAALENPSLPAVKAVWSRSNRATITGDLRTEHLLSVQISFHPGWRASVSAEDRPIRRDGIGFMVIEPRCNGPCEVQLVFDGGAELKIARLLHMSCVLFALAWIPFDLWRRRRRRV